MPDLSVVIPTYNRGRLVREAAESVLDQQTDRVVEIIVVDDGSTDDTKDQLRSLRDHVRYIRQTNTGVNAARNTGLRAASGDLIAFLDSDDVWLPFKTELQLGVLERLPEVGFVFSDFFIWRDGKRIPKGLDSWMRSGNSIASSALRTCYGDELGLAKPWHATQVVLCDIYALSLYQPVVLPSTSIVRRKVFEVEGFLPENNWMCGDWEFFARACRNFPAAYVDVETTLNRSHDDDVRLMRRDLSERTVQRIESIQRLWKADESFMTKHAAEVASTEAQEWTTLFKQALKQGRLDDARCCRARIAKLGHRSTLHDLMFAAMAIPPLRRAVGWLRERH